MDGIIHVYIASVFITMPMCSICFKIIGAVKAGHVKYHYNSREITQEDITQSTSF